MPHIPKTLSFYAARLLNAALSRLQPGEIEMLGRMCGSRLNFDEGQPIAIFAHHLWGAVSTVPNSAHLNGEQWLLERTGRFGFKTIFDVGANVGDWARLALTNHPQAELHCFEIVGTTFAQLKANLQDHAQRVVFNNFGLLDKEADVDVHVSDHHLVSSIYEIQVPENESRGIVRSSVVTGGGYARRQGIHAIDFLKVDVEGAEGQVLAGFADFFAAKAIRLLQFEYNRGAVYGGFLLKDAYALLRPHGYVLGKLTPKGVLFREFRVEHEDFSGPNYVACQESDAELIAAIGLKGA